MKVTILGNNSALPAYGRYPTAQVVEMHEQYFLMDCGEGTQMRIQQYGVKGDRIDYVFISHAHGDHYFGLVGFLSSLSLKGRTRDLYLYCPKEIIKIIDLQLPWELGYTIHYHFLKEGESELLISDEKKEITSFPVRHSVPTHGFLFREKKRKRKLLPDKLKEFEIPKYFYRKLSEGFDYESREGRIVYNHEVSIAGEPDKVYAFAADTLYHREMIPFIQGVDLLYHETTYLKEHVEKAHERFHTTTAEAGYLAQEAGVKKLIIGHFSSRYKNLDIFLEEVKMIFPNVELALEGQVFDLKNL